MTDDLEMILKFLWPFKVLPCCIPGGTERKPGKTSVRIVSVPAKI
jgi:hypothetical protein